MMHPSARFWLCLLACACSVACSKDPQKLTQIVVVVDSDLRVPDELDALGISVQGAVDMPELDVELSKALGLPRSLGLVHAGGPLGPVRVSVRGQHLGELVVERTAEVAFTAGKTLKLALPLTRACAAAGLQCESGETCIEAACAPEGLTGLPVFDGRLSGVPIDQPSAGMGGRAASDAGTAGSGATGGMGAAAEGGGGSGGAGDSGGPNQPPSCSIDSPVDGADYYEGDTVSLSGSCSDPQSGNLALVRWRSDRDGSLGTLSHLAVSELSRGEHALTLCAEDPADSSVTGCASEVHITVQPLPAITASITSITQAGTTSGPFGTDDIDASAEGSGVEPLTYTWTDSISGDVGSGEHVTLSAPVQPGKHTLVLRVTDGRDRTVTANQSFSVLPSGKSSLFETYDVVNSALSGTGALTALAAIGGTVHVATGMGIVYGFDATSTPSTASPALELTTTPDAVRDIFVHAASTTAFISTNVGVRVCPLSGNSIGNSCTTHKDAPLPGNDVKTSVRLTAGGTEYLLLGTTAGLLIAQANDFANNSKVRSDVLLSRAIVGNIYLWLATSAGLNSYELSKAINGSPKSYSNSPTGLTSITLGTSGVWVGSMAGLARYELLSGNWSTWNMMTAAPFGTTRLAGNDVRALAITKPTIAGTARDVIWVATNAGVSRYDTSVGSFTTFVKADGLPSNNVRAIVKLDSGELVFGTDGPGGGLAIYRGQ